MHPDPTQALWQSAQSLFQAGNLAAASGQCLQLIRDFPLHSGANLMLADIASANGQHRLATSHALRAAQKMGPQTLQHLAAVSLRLISVGEYDAARKLVLKLNPAAVPVPSSVAEFAQQLSLLEQQEDALRFLEVALGQGLQGDWAHYVHGNLLKFVGKLGQAADAYERSLSRNPDYAFAHHALAYLGQADSHGRRVDRIRSSLARVPRDFRDMAYLQYALFKELDAVGDLGAAWAALEAGFRDKQMQVGHDAHEETRIFDALMLETQRGFGLDGAAEPVDDSSPVPVFVLGMPRTGTTLLERVLGGNSKVALCGELNDFRMQFKWSSDYFCLGFFDLPATRHVGRVDYAELGRRYLDHVSWRLPPGISHFTDKNPSNFMMAGLVLRALPRARIIHLRRNPMDSCFSNLKELFGGNAHPYSYGFSDLATHYKNYARLMDHWHAIAPGRILDVNYEDLVSRPDIEARRVMEYCGLAYDAAQLRVESNAASVSTASSAQVRQPIHTRNIGGWKQYESQLAPLKALLGDAAD